MAALKIQLHKSQLIHNDSYEIPTATPLLPESGNTERLLGIQSFVWACWESKKTVEFTFYHVYELRYT